jgi:hypothetical protein
VSSNSNLHVPHVLHHVVAGFRSADKGWYQQVQLFEESKTKVCCMTCGHIALAEKWRGVLARQGGSWLLWREFLAQQ